MATWSVFLARLQSQVWITHCGYGPCQVNCLWFSHVETAGWEEAVQIPAVNAGFIQFLQGSRYVSRTVGYLDLLLVTDRYKFRMSFGWGSNERPTLRERICKIFNLGILRKKHANFGWFTVYSLWPSNPSHEVGLRKIFTNINTHISSTDHFKSWVLWILQP